MKKCIKSKLYEYTALAISLIVGTYLGTVIGNCSGHARERDMAKTEITKSCYDSNLKREWAKYMHEHEKMIFSLKNLIPFHYFFYNSRSSPMMIIGDGSGPVRLSFDIEDNNSLEGGID